MTKTYKYKYSGKYKVSVGGYGVVKPKEVVELSGKINHPDFEPQFKEDKPKVKNKKKSKQL